MTAPFPSTAMAALLDDNDRCLATLACLLGRIDDGDYARPLPPCEAGIGRHVRHVLDHYDALVDGVHTGEIDYDRRARDPVTETDRSTALSRISALRETLRTMVGQDGNTAVSVCMDCGTGGRRPAPSTLARELQFLVSHTVHHDALIAAAARALGVATEPGFGIAPSTLKANASRQAS